MPPRRSGGGSVLFPRRLPRAVAAGENYCSAVTRGLPKDNPELMQIAKAQITELLTEYGPIDMIFFDGDPTGLRELAWKLQPECVVTRGALNTPEQKLPEIDGEQDPAIIEPWEACFTLGRQWQYRALHEAYKSPNTLIEMLIKTCAGGGNLLLNFGPKADGTLPVEQESAMREVGLWMFVNNEAIVDVTPYHHAREGHIYYTQNCSKNSIFAHLTNIDWANLPYLAMMNRSINHSGSIPMGSTRQRHESSLGA